MIEALLLFIEYGILSMGVVGGLAVVLFFIFVICGLLIVSFEPLVTKLLKSNPTTTAERE